MQFIQDDLLSQPTESYLHLSNDAISTDISYTSLDTNHSFDTSRLLKLAKSIDNRAKLPEVKDLSKDRALKLPKFSSHSTPLADKRASLNSQIYSNDEKLNHDNLNTNGGLNEIKKIKTLLETLIKRDEGLKSEVMSNKNNSNETIEEDEDDHLSLTNHNNQDIINLTNSNDAKMPNDDKENHDQDSPVTTPPNSRDFIETFRKEDRDEYEMSYLANKSAFNNVEISLMEHQIRDLKQQTQKLTKENLTLKLHTDYLETKLNELKLKEDDDSFSNFMNMSSAKDNGLNEEIENLKALNRSLTLKLDRSRTNNNELTNEMEWLKNQMEGDKNHYHEPSSPQITKNKDSASKVEKDNERIELIKRLNDEIGDKKHLLKMESLSPEFQEYFTKLKLAKIDRLTKVEMSNLIKNIMLSLLISDFDYLPQNSMKCGKFLKISMNFLDTLHKTIYKENTGDVSPSIYLRNPELDNQDLTYLQDCLQGMLKVCLSLIDS